MESRRSELPDADSMAGSVLCPACGERNAIGATFCGGCGTPVAADDWRAVTAAVAIPATIAAETASSAAAETPTSGAEPGAASDAEPDTGDGLRRCSWCGASNPPDADTCATCHAAFPHPAREALLLDEAEARLKAAEAALTEPRPRRGLSWLFRPND